MIVVVRHWPGWLGGRAVPQTKGKIRRERDIPAWSLCTGRMDNKTKQTIKIKLEKIMSWQEKFQRAEEYSIKVL